MKRVVVLGAGMVGAAIAADLCREVAVTAVDADAGRLRALAEAHPLAVRTADLRDPAAVRAAVTGADLAIGAVPGFMGFATLRAVIEAGVDVVDISFFDEDPFDLDALAQARGVTAVTDAGVAPGLSNLVLGYEATRLEVDSFRCLVGGLPARRSWPWQYKAPFSPIDVLEEYTRPARLVEHGAVVVKPALSEPELVEFEPVGTLEAFNTDGLRTLLRTMRVPSMAEKTLRYPGHIEYVRVLRESGFLGAEPIQVGDVSVRPIDLAAALLFPRWRLTPGEPEFTVMEIAIRGHAAGKPGAVTYRLFDRTDERTGTSSMARTTGYTCTAIARLVLDGRFARKGICPPEYVGAQAGCYEQVIADLRARGVALQVSSQPDAGGTAEALHVQSPPDAARRAQAVPAAGAVSGESRLALVNGRIVLPDRVVTGQALVIAGGRIAGLTDPAGLGTDVALVDASGCWITPGLVDIHTHGALRHTFNEPDVAAWTAITEANLRRGTTALLATFGPTPNLAEELAFCRQWMRDSRGGACVLGAYLESPFINVAQKGALDPSCVRAVDDETAAVLLQFADILRVFMLAPELPGALALIEALNAAGIVPAAGHTTAQDTHVAAAVRAGLRHVTHLWSSMSLMVREGPWRKPGMLEAALTMDGLTAEIIADDRHLPATLMRLAYKCLGPDRLCAVSDALAGAGLPEGSVYTMGGMSYDVHDGVGMMLDRSAFAGSTTLLPQMLPVLIDVAGIPLVEAVRMVTLTPARIIGADRDRGSLEPGKRADLVLFDDAFGAQRVMLGGEWT